MLHDVLNKLGFTAPFVGLAVSHSTVNLWLQTLSLLLGISVGIYALLVRRREYNTHKTVKNTKNKATLNK